MSNGAWQYSAAEEEIEWYFRWSEAHSIQAAGLEPKGGAVFDDEASWRLHRRMHSPEHRDVVKKRARIEAALWTLEPETRAALKAAYTMPSSHVSVGTVREFRRAGSNACLLGIALGTTELRLAMAAYHRQHGRFVDPTRATLIEFCNDETQRGGRAFESARAVSDAILMAAMESYETARGKRDAKHTPEAERVEDVEHYAALARGPSGRL